MKIKSLIGRATEYIRLEDGLDVVMSDEVTIPFIYFKRIVVPGCIDDKDIPQVIRHEIIHYQNSHFIDNVLFSLFHVLYWANPFYRLIRRAQKLYHEFQVDNQILSTGVDPVSYKLSLIKYSVGNNLYSLANGLSNTNTKTRLLMINKTHIREGRWRVFFLLPTMAILFIIFCFANIEPNIPEIQTNVIANISQDDTLRLDVEFNDSYLQSPEGKNATRSRNAIVILMNRNAEIMIDREQLPLRDVEQKVISEYSIRLEQINEYNTGDYPEGTDFGVKILVYKDIATSIDEYQKMCAAIITALIKLREMQSIRLFGENYSSLEGPEKKAVDELVPLRIYGKKPDKNMNQQVHIK